MSYKINLRSAGNMVKGSIASIKALIVDATLSVSGAAADAKVTGDKLGEKVNTADIVNHLESDDTEVPLSAMQGKILKTLIDNFKASVSQSLQTLSGNLSTAAQTANDALPKSGGTMSGEIKMGSNKITGLANPTSGNDAANKTYVDSKTATAKTEAVDAAKNNAKTIQVTATLTVSGWVGTAAPYTQSVAISAANFNNKNASAHPAYSGDTSTKIAQKEAAAAISYAEKGTDEITFTCLEEKPGVDVPIVVEVYV